MKAEPMTRPARLQVRDATPLANGCPVGDACGRRAADALERIAANLDEIKPAMTTIHEFGDRLEKTGLFMKRWGPRLLWILPALLTFSNLISPELADALGRLIVEAAAAAPLPGDTP